MAKNKYIETPEILLDYFNSYVKEVKSNPFLIKDWVGKDAEQVYREKEKPITIEGFECWLFERNIIQDIGDYLTNKDGRYNEYIAVCSHILRYRRKDQIEGGMAGIYNPSVTQRLNGLVDKTESTVLQEQPLFPDTPNK